MRPRAPPKFEETDFSAVGESSLLLFRLQNTLKERMGVQMPLHELYQASTLGKTAAKTSKEKKSTSHRDSRLGGRDINSCPCPECYPSPGLPCASEVQAPSRPHGLERLPRLRDPRGIDER